jgi:hypothetical protein
MKLVRFAALIPVAVLAVGCCQKQEVVAPAIDGRQFWEDVCNDRLAYEDMTAEQQDFFNTTRPTDFGVEDCMSKSYK